MNWRRVSRASEWAELQASCYSNGKIELDPIWTDQQQRRTYGNGESSFLRKLYGILMDERNSCVLLQRSTEIRLRINGNVRLETSHCLLIARRPYCGCCGGGREGGSGCVLYQLMYRAYVENVQCIFQGFEFGVVGGVHGNRTICRQTKSRTGQLADYIHVANSPTAKLF